MFSRGADRVQDMRGTRGKLGEGKHLGSVPEKRGCGKAFHKAQVLGGSTLRQNAIADE